MPNQEIRLVLPDEPNEAISRMLRPLIGLTVTIHTDSDQSFVEWVVQNVFENDNGDMQMDLRDGWSRPWIERTLLVSQIETLEVL